MNSTKPFTTLVILGVVNIGKSVVLHTSAKKGLQGGNENQRPSRYKHVRADLFFR